MFKPVPVGDRTRYSYARINEILPMPHLIDIQRKSYEWFIKEGLNEILHDISPIKDFTGNLELSFEGFTLGEPKYTVEECKERDATYSAPLKVEVRLHNKETDTIKEHEIYIGDLPLMTDTGSFVSMEQSVLSLASWYVHLVFILLSTMIRPEKSCTLLRSSRIVEHGLSMRQTQMIFSM